ncbi:MAG: RsmB/NOP family class I SAM-dependent RNA methyltransferase [Spirochaetota bacterium]
MPEGRGGVNKQRHLAALWRAYIDHPTARQADKWLAGYFREHRSYGKRDRRWYSEEFFRLLRTAIGHLPEAVTTDAATAWRALPSLDLARSASPGDGFNLPGTWKRWLEHSSIPQEKMPQFLSQLGSKPPLYLRVNYPERLSEIETELSTAGFSVETLRHDERWITLKIVGELPVYELASLKKGFIEIQDLASQHLGAAVDAHPGMAVWDVCAGGGGKTMQIASQMQNRGVLYASDIRDYKLDELKLRARRAGFHNVRRFTVSDGAIAPAVTAKEIKNAGGFHRVLVDAPCSSSGTLRRNPDVRFRIMPDDPEKFAALQLNILGEVCGHVRAGGKLIYSTCSVFKTENEDVVHSFLAQHPEFQLVESRWVGSPDLDSDTMFYAVLARA